MTDDRNKWRVEWNEDASMMQSTLGLRMTKTRQVHLNFYVRSQEIEFFKINCLS